MDIHQKIELPCGSFLYLEILTLGDPTSDYSNLQWLFHTHFSIYPILIQDLPLVRRCLLNLDEHGMLADNVLSENDSYVKLIKDWINRKNQKSAERDQQQENSHIKVIHESTLLTVIEIKTELAFHVFGSRTRWPKLISKDHHNCLI